MEHLKRRKQNKNNAKHPRPKIPEADKFIEQFLKVNIDADPEKIWKSLPESQDYEDLYRDSAFLYCSSFPTKKLSIRAFEIRVKKIRERLTHSGATCNNV